MKYNVISKSNSCNRCIGCKKCENISICVFCGRNANDLSQLGILKKKADIVEQYSKIAIASTENTLMPMIQLSIIFPKLIHSFINKPKIQKVKDIQENWIFFSTVLSLTFSIISMAGSQTAKYFASVGKAGQKKLVNRIFYGLSIIMQVFAKVIIYQTFAFGIIGYALEYPFAIMITLLLLPIVMSIIKIISLYGLICIKQCITSKAKIKWCDISPLLLTSSFVFIRIQGHKELTHNSEETQTLKYEDSDSQKESKNANVSTISGFYDHFLFECLSFCENLVFVTIGVYYIEVDEFESRNKIIFCSAILGLHLLGVLIKCAYYQFGHPWMSLSQKLAKTSAYLFAIYGTLGLAIIATLFYLGIEKNLITLTVTATLICLLVLLTFAGVVIRKTSNGSYQTDIEI